MEPAIKRAVVALTGTLFSPVVISTSLVAPDRCARIPHRQWIFSRSFEHVREQPPIVDGRCTYRTSPTHYACRAPSADRLAFSGGFSGDLRVARVVPAYTLHWAHRMHTTDQGSEVCVMARQMRLAPKQLAEHARIGVWRASSARAA